MRFNTKYLAFFLASAALGGATMSPQDANASYTRRHAAECKTFNGTPKDVDYSLQNDSTTSAMQILCAFNDSDAHPGNLVRTVNVHVHDGSNVAELVALTCYAENDAIGGGCGLPASTTQAFTGPLTLQPSVFWATTAFRYTWVSLPAKTSAGSRSALAGVYTGT